MPGLLSVRPAGRAGRPCPVVG